MSEKILQNILVLKNGRIAAKTRRSAKISKKLTIFLYPYKIDKKFQKVNLDFSGIPILQNRKVRHFLFWILILLVSSTNWRAYEVNYIVELTYYLFLLIPSIFITYFNIYFLIPKFLLPSKFEVYALIFISLLIIGAFFRRALVYYLLPELFPVTAEMSFAVRPFFHWGTFLYNFSSILSVVTFASMIKMSKIWHQKEVMEHQLKKEKLEVELNMLKGQINPHFFFNTLNNLYALTLENSEKSPEVVLQLSDMMDYMIYKSNVDFIELKSEIEMLENYIRLEKIRYPPTFQVSVQVLGNISGVKVAPLLFLPFLENSFKHGADKSLENPWISLSIQVTDSDIELRVENSKPDAAEPIQKNGGVGLKNVKKRLELIYGERHQLQLYEDKEIYSVVLKIPKINE